MRRSKKISKFRIIGLCEGNSPVAGEFSSQRASKAEMFPFYDVIVAWQMLGNGSQCFMSHIMNCCQPNVTVCVRHPFVVALHNLFSSFLFPGLGSHLYSPRGSTYSSHSTHSRLPASPRTESDRQTHSLDSGERDYHCYSSSYDTIYRPRYLDSRDPISYDTSYVDTYSDLYRPYSYYNSGS